MRRVRFLTPGRRETGGPDAEGYAYRPLVTQPAGAAVTWGEDGFGAKTVSSDEPQGNPVRLTNS